MWRTSDIFNLTVKTLAASASCLRSNQDLVGPTRSSWLGAMHIELLSTRVFQKLMQYCKKWINPMEDSKQASMGVFFYLLRTT